MSSSADRIPGIDQAPYVGALLRLAHGVARERIFVALSERGMGDLGPAYAALFQYPPIDGMRPTELAKRLGVSKQALNHTLGQVEKLGYLERRTEPGKRPSAIYFTERGWQVLEITIATMRQLEIDWQNQLGPDAFADFKATLKALAGVT